jgi:hypothetical protein
MKQLIHSNGSNESNERKLTFSRNSEKLCAMLCHHGRNNQRQKTPTATFENGSPGRRGKTRVGRPNRAHTATQTARPRRPPPFYPPSDCQVFEITVTFFEITGTFSEIIDMYRLS